MKWAILFLLVLTLPLALADISVMPEILSPGDVVRITIEPAIASQTLIIVSPTSTYRFVGGLEKTTSFVPDVPGTYSIRLQEENDIIAVASFSVLGELAGVEHLDGLVVSASQPQVGEPITVDAPLMGVDKITASLGGNTWTSVDGIRPLTYIPNQGGNLTFTVFYVNGSSERVVVTVKDTRPLVEVVDTTIQEPFFIARKDDDIVLQTTTGTELRLQQGTYDVDVGDVGVTVKFKGFQHKGLNVRFEKVPIEHSRVPRAVDSFAVDPTNLEFDSAEITFTAVGNELYKCVEYNYSTRTCTGEHVKLLDLIPGNEYTIPLTKEDPLYTQTGYLTNPTFVTNTNPWTTLTESGNIVYSWQSSDTPQTAVAQIALSGSNKVGVGNYYQPFNLTIPVGTSLVQINFSAKWRVSTYSDPGSIDILVQNLARTVTYCTVNVGFSGTTTWRKQNVTTGVTPGCNLASFSPNTNYTFRLRCNLDTASGGGQSEVCRWDDASIIVTYSDSAPPVFRDILDTPDPVNYGEVINFTVNITDNVGVNTSIIEVDGVNYTLLKGSGDIYYYDTYNTAKTPGLYYFRLFSNDSEGNTIVNGSNALNFTIRDVAGPTIELLGPDSPIYTRNVSFIVFFNLTDQVGVDYCGLVVNGTVVNSTTTTPLSTTLNLSGALGVEGFHLWNVTCNDTSDNPTTTSARQIVRDTIPPVILLGLPDASRSKQASTVFRHTPTDSTLSTCSLYGDFTGSWLVNQTNTTPVSGVENLFTAITLGQGSFLWNVRCTDLAGNVAYNITNFTYVIDYQPPNWSAQVVTPVSNTKYVLGAAYDFNITVTDNLVDNITVVLENNRTGVLVNDTAAVVGDRYRVTLTDLAAGNYRYRWYMNDSLGNTNSTTVSTYTVQKADASVTIVLNNSYANRTAGLNEWINITGTLVTPSSGLVQVFIDGSLVASNNSIVHYLVQLTTEKRYNITIKYPATRNYSQISSTLFADVLDTTPPTVSLSSPANNSNIQPDVLFYFTPNDNVEIANCTLVLDDLLNKTKDVTKGVLSNISLASIPDGIHNWTMNCSDTTNNSYTNTTRWYFTVDGVAPSAFSLLLPVSGNISSNRTPVFTWQSSSDTYFDRYTIQVDNDINFGSINHHKNRSGVTNTSMQFTLADQTKWFWRVFAYDQAGNVRQSTQTFNYTTDTVNPGVSLNTPENNSYLNATLVNLSYSVSDFSAIANCSLFINGTLNTTNNSVVVGDRWFIIDASEGVYTWNVLCRDVAGNVNMTMNRTFTVDTTLPTSFLTSGPQNNSIINDDTPEYSWFASTDTNFDRYVVQVSDNESFPYFNYTFTNPGVANTSVNQSPAMSDNTWYWRVIAYDFANNYYISHPSFDTDTTPPTVFDLTDPVNDTQQQNSTPLFMWEQSNDPHFLNYTLLVSQSPDFSTVVATNGTYSKTETSAWLTIPQNTWLYWMVIAWDAANNSRNSTNTFTYLADFINPYVQLFAPGNEEEITTNSLISFQFNVTDMGTVANCTLVINDSIVKTLTAPQENVTVTITNTLENGHYEWYMNCTDKAGNTGRSGDRNVTVNVSVPTLRLYETSLGVSNYTSVANINLSDRDSFENMVSFTVPGGGIVTAANATLVTRGEGLLIFNDTLVNFSGVFSQSHNNVFYVTRKLYKQNTSGDTLLCQDGDDNTGGTAVGTTAKKTLIGSCTILDGDVRLYANDNITLTVNMYSSAGPTRTFTHFWDDPSESWVQFDGYDLGRLVVNFTNLTDPAINESSSYIEVCNVTCVDGTCLSTELYLERWDGSAWVNASGSGNVTLNGSQVNPVAIGNLNTSEPTNISLYGNLYSFNNSFRCYATSVYSTAYSPEKNISVLDRLAPNVTLNLPPDTAAYDPQNITFEFTAIDVRLTNCSLWGNWSGTWEINQTVTNMTSGVQANFDPVFLSYGVYAWNVQCYDNASNNAFATNNFTLYIAGNLEITSDKIYFSDESPIESDPITITANVTNLANRFEPDVVVSFYNGVPGDGGVQINGDKHVSIGALSWNTTSVQWPASIGTNNIYVVVDPPNGSGLIIESDETNNIANRTITTSIWQIYYGNVTGNVTLGINTNDTFLSWELGNISGNIFVADVDTTGGIGWTFLRPLGRTTSGLNTTDTNNDFSELDTSINTEQYADSVNRTYRNASGSRYLDSFLIYGTNLANVSLANTSGNFSSGILWDSDDSGNSYYDSVDDEDVLFVTRIKNAVQSPLGFIEYEIWIPSNFTNYKGATSEVQFFYEIQ